MNHDHNQNHLRIPERYLISIHCIDVQHVFLSVLRLPKNKDLQTKGGFSYVTKISSLSVYQTLQWSDSIYILPVFPHVPNDEPPNILHH